MTTAPSSSATAPFADLTLRDTVQPRDEATVRALVDSTGRFSSAECDVAAELVREHLARGRDYGYWFLFADRAGAPVGYVCYGPIACTVGSFDLYWIAVDRTQQHAGIGRWLMAACEDRVRAAGGRRIFIDTSSRADYGPTRAFYERCGYRVAAVLDDFYNTGDGKVVFGKVL